MTQGPLELKKKALRVAAPMREQVLDLLREEIVSGNIPPGRRLIERELVTSTGTSRTTIREVVQHLVAEGLLVPVEPRGVAVAVPTAKSLSELYEVRAALEGILARDFVRQATSSDFGVLARAFQSIRKNGNSPAKLLKAKDEFYACLNFGANNVTVTALLEVLHTRVALARAASLRAPGRVRESIRELTALYDAIKAGDADQAAKLASLHVQQAGVAALSQFNSFALTHNANPA